ncbi:MAG: glycerophosphodiester phosphodiesterase family protein [Chlamydiota bacterium]
MMRVFHRRMFWLPTLFIFFACNTLAYSVCSQHLSVIAHRGNSSENPENTLASFQSAIDQGVDYIELDVHLCKNGVPCVIHDRSLSRTTNSENIMYVEELSIDDIKVLDAGTWYDNSFSGEQVPTLEEVLQLPLGKTGVMIEIKKGSNTDEKLASAVSSIVRKYARVKSGNPLIVGSLSPEITTLLRSYLPELPIIAIIEDLDDLPRFKPSRAKIYAVQEDLLSQHVYDRLSREGKVVWSFTVDEKDRMYQLAELGVSGIITNRPKDLIEVREELTEKCYDVINVSRVK